MTRNFFRRHFPGLLVSALAFAVYVLTLSPFMIWEDSGELATVAATLGVAHPTGYPLFSLLGRAFSLLPLGDLRVIVKLNVLSALLCATAIGFFYQVFLILIADRGLFPRRRGAGEAADQDSKDSFGAGMTERLSAALGALALAFSWTFWSEAVSFEVYAMHLFMSSIVTFLFLLSLKRPESPRRWFLFSYVLGLSFAHHMMTVLLAPAFLTLYFSLRGFARDAWMRIVRAVPAFLLGLSPYLYLPIRSSAGPTINWGDPSNWERFLYHVSGGQYRFKMFSSVEVASRKFGGFVGNFTREFGVLPLLLALLGIWAVFRFRTRLFAFTALLFATGVLYAVNYDFEDPNFFLPAWVMIAAWSALGAFHAMMWARARGKGVTWGVAIVCGVAAAQPLASNYGDADESANHAVEDYARNVLASVAPNGALFTDQSEALISPACYLQRVEGARPDVVVWDRSQWIAGHAWYFDDMERAHPGALRGARAEVDAYARLVRELQDRMPLAPADSVAYRAASARALDAVFRAYFSTRPVQATIDAATSMLPALQQRFDPGLGMYPEGLTFRFFRGELPAPVSRPVTFRPLVAGKGMVDRVSESYAAGFTNMAAYRLMTSRDTLEARVLLQRALAVRPGYPPALQWLQRL